MRLFVTYENRFPLTQADAEQFVNTAFALARAGAEVTFAVPHNPELSLSPSRLRELYQVEGDLEVVELETAHPNVAVQHARHAEAASRHPACRVADLVYTRNLGMLTAALTRGHRAAYEHYRPWGDQVPPLQPLLRATMTHRNYLGTILHSEFARRSYVRLGIPEERLTVFHNGWEPRRMEPRLTSEQARRQLGLPLDRPIVTYAGRINERKGLDVVLEMAERLPEVLFVLVGSEGRGPIEERADAMPNVHVEPWKSFSEIAPYLYAADVLTIPPSSTPLQRHGNTVLPLKLFLYLASGRPILAPASPDLAELLEDGRNAALVPPGDVDRATDALRRLTSDPALRNRFGEAARAQARELTWDARGRGVLAFLQSRSEAHRRGSEGAAAGPWSVGSWIRQCGRWAVRGVREGAWLAGSSEPGPAAGAR